MRLAIPKLRTWHLLGIVAASAAFFSVMQFRWSVEDPGYALIRQLRSSGAAERAKAAERLGGLRPRERRAISPLAEALSDGDARVRAATARTLSQIVPSDDPEAGFVKAALASALGDRDPVARRSVALALANHRLEPAAIVPTLLGFVGDVEPEARAEAIASLGLYARRSVPARLAVFAALDDPDFRVRWRAVNSLAWCSAFPDLAPQPLMGTIVAALVKAADDESPHVRAAVVRTLGGLGARTRVEIPRVIGALDDPDGDVRHQAATYLSWGRPGKRSAALVPALGRALRDRSSLVRRAAAATLGRLGIDAEAALPALPALRSSADDPDVDVRRSVAGAIAAIEKADRDSRSELAKSVAELGDADPDVRALAADRLAGAGPRGVEAIPSLVRCLADREADVRRAAAGALGQLGPRAGVAVPSLANLAESDGDERVRRAATLSRSILVGNGGEDRQP